MARWVQVSLPALFAAVAFALLGETPAAPIRPVHAAYAEKIPDSNVSFDMVAIVGGTFDMGSPSGEKGRGDDEGPQHPVSVRSFWMGKCEVTWDEFNVYRKETTVEERLDQIRLLEKNPDAVTGPTPPYADETWDHGREGHPVLGISHHAAMSYCWWLSKKTGKRYRLPTEAEWEYAARASTKTAYFFGDDPKQLDDYAWHAGNSQLPGVSDPHPQKVGKKKPNPWGLYDMYGNVAEYCIDHYYAEYYARFPLDQPTLQPVPVLLGRRFSHVVRGGSWADQVQQCRSAARRGSERSWLRKDPMRPPSIWWLTDADFVGFRVVRAVEEQDNLKYLRPVVTFDSP
jgi:formylglycine-generating enzyme required for sulfatase activity